VTEKSAASSGPVYRFGVFQVNLSARELRKHGMRVRLPGQPFCILTMLLEKPGEVITREEMQQKLWASDTFVDFEHSLNSAIKKLRAALGDTPENSRYIETVPRAGYRFVAPLEEVPANPRPEAGAQPTADRSDIHAAEEESPRRTWVTLTAISILFLAALGAYFQWSRSRGRLQRPGGRLMLAVLPFENLTGDAGQDYFSDGLTEEMIAQLGRLDPEHLGVIARTSVMHYKRAQEPLDQIARELGVQYVLEGSVRRDAGKVRISAQLVQVEDQRRVWTRQYDRELSSLLALQGEIAQEIADEIHLTLGQGLQHVTADRKPAASSNSYEAYDFYLKGRYFWNKRTKEGFEQAAGYFQQAIAEDPTYAPAYAGLADTFGLMSTWYLVPQSEFMPKARIAALKALQIDEAIAEAHASLALIAENYDYDWQTAEKEFRRAIQLDPGYATAHHWYAEYLSWQGRFDEALAESERARRLDPLSLIIATDHGAILYLLRQYDRAIEQSRAVLGMEPTFLLAYGVLIDAEVQSGKFNEALADCERSRRTAGANIVAWGKLAYLYGLWGRQAEARHALAELKRSLRPSQSDVIPALLLAYLGTKQKDEVIALLQKAYSEHSNAVVVMKVDPKYDPLRSDPRFQDLLRRVGLADGGTTGRGTAKP
jgi:TolB-like protein/DNA-binding winged helix-turn-helix (wHTH) protein/Flp pilus assembly protein TadD